MALAICPATGCRYLAKVYWKHLEPWWENLHAHARAARLKRRRKTKERPARSALPFASPGLGGRACVII